ncbi:type IV pilus assembly protein PilM [Vibrio salilacus]|uniref:type IV pilus assembly protein PilM n=1 Tax=Vibrio salilacus TaxID=1323749 RepID=UPI000C2A4016|nr:type IV pilus assembly protein PilM [Vibrio salilacus]
MGISLVTGLDIGRHSIKAVVIKPSKDAFALVAYRTLPIEVGILADNHRLNYQKIVKKLKELRKSLPLFSHKVAFAIPDNQVITKALQIDSEFSRAERELAIYQTFASQCAFAADQLCLDYSVSDHVTPQGGVHYRVHAAKKAPLLELSNAIAQANFKPIVADVASYALNQCWHQVAQSQHAYDWLLVDIAVTQCHFSIGLPSGEVYAKSWRLEAQLNDGQKVVNSLRETLRSAMQRLTSLHQIEVKGIWLSSETGNCPDLAAKLSDELGIKVEPFNPLGLFQHLSTNDASNGYALAVGLALRASQWQERHHARVD